MPGETAPAGRDLHDGPAGLVLHPAGGAWRHELPAVADPVDPVSVLAARKAAAAVKALTLWQPWATLVAAGIKSIETRSWRTSYRGRLAIHASKRRPPAGEAVGRGRVSRYRLAEGLYWQEYDERRPLYPLPLGMVVATCRLADCCPIGGPHDFRTGLVEGDAGDWPGQPVLVLHPPLVGDMGDALILDRPRLGNEDVTDQLPYGDYTAGRWGWLLEDIEPLAHPVPARGRQGLWEWEWDGLPALAG